MTKRIFIFILEGEESYTEVNFFNNMSHFINQEKELIPIAFIKSVKTSPKQRNVDKFYSEFVNKLENYKKNDEIQLFFIADGDDKKQIPAIKTTHKLLCQELEQIKEYNLKNNNLIIPSNKKFEDVLNYNFKSKSKSYLTGFHDFYFDKKLTLSNIEPDWKKIIEYFLKTEYAPIFLKIKEIVKK